MNPIISKSDFLNLIKLGNIEKLKEFKNNGLKLIDVMNGKYGYHVDHFICAANYPDIIRLLIEWEKELSLDCILSQIAVCHNLPSIARIAIEMGADINGGEDNKNDIIKIVEYNYIELAKIYIDAGCDLNVYTYDNRNIYHCVRSHEMLDIILPYMQLKQVKDIYNKTPYEYHINYFNKFYKNNPSYIVYKEIADRMKEHLDKLKFKNSLL